MCGGGGSKKEKKKKPVEGTGEGEKAGGDAGGEEKPVIAKAKNRQRTLAKDAKKNKGKFRRTVTKFLFGKVDTDDDESEDSFLVRAQQEAAANAAKGANGVNPNAPKEGAKAGAAKAKPKGSE